MQTTASRGTPARQGAESTVGKNNPAGQADLSGGHAKAVESSEALQLNPEQRQQIKDAIARQQAAPRVEKAPFEMMIGTSVPGQMQLKDIPPEITRVMNGYWGDQYLLCRTKCDCGST